MSEAMESKVCDAPAVKKTEYDIPQWSKGNYEINWVAVAVLALPPLMGIGALMAGVPLQTNTLIVGVLFYIFNGMIGITVGYHRLFSHRSFTAHPILQWICAFAGAGAFEGSAKWWCRNHRIHHRYVDTFKDPYDATRGFFFSHIGWMIMKQNYAIPARVDVSDFKYNNIIQFQHRHFFKMAIASGIILPTLVCGLGWGDWLGGYFYAAILKIVFVHHCTFFINSLAHTDLFGAVQTYSDRHTPHDSVVCALLTFGEGYHNFHHEFSQDYRNGIKWYHYDPTKWVIRLCEFVGLASRLVRTPNDIIKLNVNKLKYKRLLKQAAILEREMDECEPAETKMYTWEDIHSLVEKGRKLIVVSNRVIDLDKPLNTGTSYTHDNETFQWYEVHPGGRQVLDLYIGKDATKEFGSGMHKHSAGAESLLHHLQVGYLNE
ncbi:fatty acid desaturase, putative [Trypanosoma equiperdum]|uniref:Fatty acid desaturase, putative n=2 Tax=Trypanozoon TaxID=39700 RepID=Q57YK1_TRYB2|nr:fatty acid desaturase, putative [Trypanosoma brucei brucei TREU927]AAX69294.1 fatty acid desaturase, putative [Trypanosoma brucei]AAZ13364.1 fatty acid desaturase, putative [Trypanosoma brucei brucei TREU927]SCU64573.1 fatty acid desaturase, putative [Trypanosoma equiperdum]